MAQPFILGSCEGSRYCAGQPWSVSGGPQLEVPGLVPEDLAQPVARAVPGQPRGGVCVTDVDRITRHVRRGGRRGDPSGRLRPRAVRRKGVLEQLLLVGGGAPPTGEPHADPGASGIRRGVPERSAQLAVEPGHARVGVVEHRGGLGQPTVGHTQRTGRFVGSAAQRFGSPQRARRRTTRRGRAGSRRRRRTRRRAASEKGRERADHQDGGEGGRPGAAPEGGDLLAGEHAAQSRQRRVATTSAVLDTPTICTAL